jgi:septal ring factor EnvC (AmiA/AmiB activator)
MAESGDGGTENLRTQLTVAHEELLRRDQAFRAWESEVAELRGELRRIGEWASKLEGELKRVEAELERVNDSASRRIAELEAVIAAMKATRVWRSAERWWAFRGRFRRSSADRT